MNRKPKEVQIQSVSPEFLRQVICHHIPRGYFLAKEGHKWVAVDNSTLDTWTEEFRWKHHAVCWLRGEFEVGDRVKPWDRISVAESLIAVAGRQGITLTAEEANVILGYLEGHEYCLMVNADGNTVRHNEQYAENHRGDEPYSVYDAIAFCQEMNEDLICDSGSASETTREYLAQLHKDEQLLASLMARLVFCPAGIACGS